MKFYGGVWGGKRKSDKILIAIQITVLTFQLEIQPLLNKLWAGYKEIFRVALQ